MKIAIANDHGGTVLKKALLRHLGERRCECIDLGTDGTDPVDYPDYALKCAEAVVRGDADLGIVICGTGIGVSIAANKVKGIRCALCGDVYSAKMTRSHNDANMLALGARVIGEGLACEIVDAFLDSSFAGGRHAARVAKISRIEEIYMRGNEE